jgi:sec-independent protein translocase protein TatC
MPIGPARMPFLAHMDELRKRMFVIVGALLVTSIIMYFFSDFVFQWLIYPVRDSFPHGVKPIVIDPLEAMTLRFMLAFWSSVVIMSPLITWEMMAFFLPALKPRERKWLVPTFIAMVVLFAIGVAFAYIMILPVSFSWLIQQAGNIMQTTLRADSTITVVEFFLIGFGIAFQTPIIVFYLVYFGVIKYKRLRENWRVIYVVMFIVASMITPDFSPISMTALAVAMILLYEITMFLLRIVLNRKIKAQNLELAEEAT